MKQYGIDFPSISAFILVNVVSFLCVGWIIQALCDQRLHVDRTEQRAAQMSSAFRKMLDMRFGWHIGNIERIIYIYAIMFDKLSLLTAWVILKAFFGWLEKPKLGSSAQMDGIAASSAEGISDEAVATITAFYSYIYGNGISLLSGVFLAHVGLVLSRVISLSL
jgi:hypothetical protein